MLALSELTIKLPLKYLLRIYGENSTTTVLLPAVASNKKLIRQERSLPEYISLL
jgi:hypothetical protein